MSIFVPINGSNYIIPTPNEVGWGSNLDAFFVAISAGCLQKTGGSFTLSAETDFGGTFGLKSLYLKSRTANPSSTGILRLANGDNVSWRNNLNTLDIPLSVNASDKLTFNGVEIAVAVNPIFAGTSTFLGQVLVGPTVPRTTRGVTPILQLEGLTSATSRSLYTLDSNDASGPYITFAKSRGTVLGSNTAVQNDDDIGGITGFAADGTNIDSIAGTIKLSADWAATPGVVRGRWTFWTANGAGVQIERLRIDSGGTATFTGQICTTQTGSQIVLGTTRTVELNAPTPAVASRIVTIPDLNGDYNVVGTIGTQSIGGAKTFSTQVTINPTTNQLILGTTNTITLTAPTPAASRVYTIPDAGTSASFVMTELAQTINGLKTFTGVVTIPIGAVGAPSLTFAGNPNTGLYSPVADNVSIALGGVQYAAFGTSSIYLKGQITVDGGTVGAPTYSFNNDTNTGIFRNGTDQFSLVTNGTSGLRIDSIQNVHIDTGQLLLTSQSAAAPSLAFNVDSNTGIYLAASDSLGFSTGSVECGRFSSTGAFSAKGTVTNDDAASGYIGQYIESIVANTAFPATTVYGDLTSISLTAGDWDVSLTGNAFNNGGTWVGVRVGISQTSGNSGTGLTQGSSMLESVFASSATTPLWVPLSIPVLRISLASTTTIYYKFRGDYSAGSPVLYGQLSARRVR
jgi:hypothetical protein